MMEEFNVDLEGGLMAFQCHFNWGLEEYEESYLDPKTQVDDHIHRYNLVEHRRLSRRFNCCLYLAYIMHRNGLDGWDKLLENGFRIMENSKDPNYPPGLNTLPSYDIPLYTGSTDEFFADAENVSTTSDRHREVDHNSISEESDHEQRLIDEYDSFMGMHEAAEHAFYSLKATFLHRTGSPPCEVLDLLSHVVPVDDMTPSSRAALLVLKASTIRHCGDRGLDSAMEILKTAILTDPDNLRWPLILIIYSGEERRLKWGQPIDRSELQFQVDIIDAVLQHDLEPHLRVSYQFNKLQALNEMRNSCKDEISAQERASLYQKCYELNETLVHSTDNPNFLAYCAQFFSSKHTNIPKAVRLIEHLLEKKPDCVYINAKASNIYRKTGKLGKALECAEKASTRGFGSCWQVFELKLALKQDFDYEEFFSILNKNYPQDYHVKITVRNAALFAAVQGDFKHALAHFKALFDKFDSDDHIYGEAYVGFMCKIVCTVEAAYNVASYVTSIDYNHDDKEGIVSLCYRILGEIEEKFDLNGFKYSGRFTPKQYVEWLRQKRMIGSHDSGHFTAGVASRMPDYHGDRHAGGERSKNYQDRGSAYQNRYSMNSEPSDYTYRPGDNRAADGQNRIIFGNRIDSGRRTAFHDSDHPPRQSHDRLSERRRINASSAENMANSAKKTVVDCAKTRSARPHSAGMYPGANQHKYKPSFTENWRSRSDSAEETRPSSSRKSADSCRNWRERGNCVLK